MAKNIGTWPPITSFSAGPPPLYGTCVMTMPVFRRKSSPDKCCAEPLPDDGFQVIEVTGEGLLASPGELAGGLGTTADELLGIDVRDTEPHCQGLAVGRKEQGVDNVQPLVLEPAHRSSLNQIAMVAASGVAAVAILTLALLALGHRWQVAGHMKQ